MRGTPTHVHRRPRSKHRPAGSGAVVRKFSESERPVAGTYRILSADGRLLGAGPDLEAAQKQARAMGEGARVEEVKRKRRAA